MLDVKLGSHQFSVATGERLAISGPSGCGKTQLLFNIAGLRQSVGTVTLGTQVLQNSDQFMSPHLRNIAMQFQHRELFTHLSVANNILFANPALSRSALATHIVITELSLKPLLNKSVTKLSGGEQQRVALARALTRDSALLILDEPFQGLDEVLKNKAIKLISREDITGGRPTIFVSHDQHDIERLAHNTHLFKEPL